MARLPDFDPLEFLVTRRFGKTFALSAEWRPQKDPALAREISAYRSKLGGLPKEEFDKLVSEEQERHRAELKEKADREERDRPFHQPSAAADYDHWSRAAHWTLDEAVALSFGKAPEHVTWEKVKSYVQVSPFALQYQRRRDLALRAVTWKQLFNPVLPGVFLAWAKRLELEVPAELEAAVTARGVQIMDWNSLYDELKATYDENHKNWLEICQTKNDDIAFLLKRVKQLEDAAAPSPPAEKAFGIRERESLLKLIIGMAIGGYGYDPRTSRSEQPAAIATDLATSGVGLDVDTVRKWLKKAAELLPPTETE